MNSFERDLRLMTSNLQKYSLIEFYHEEMELKQRIKKMERGLGDFAVYLPKARVTCTDLSKAQTTIRIDLRERINSFVEKIDHTFALDNYKYVMEQIADENIKDIYRKLGPFDHFEHRDPDEMEMDA